MTVVDINDAKAYLSKLIEEAAAGNDVILTHYGNPVARLTRLGAQKRTLKFGLLKGKIKVSRGFDVPLPSDALSQFEGR
jgi:prevent-host-death family protein